MNSEERVYVYMQLPRSLELVTAASYTLVERGGGRVGRFRYNPHYLERADAVPLDPFELPLAPRPVTTTKLNGIFGALRDASPDAWGRRVIDRELGRTGLSEAEYLLHSPDDRAGALSFGHGKDPPGPFRGFNRMIHIEALLRLAERIANDERKHDGDDKHRAQFAQVDALLRPGTSLGGARPKNVVEDDEGLWIAKFPDRGDRWSNARVEHSMLRLARECGINAAYSKIVTVGEADVLLVKRFDRERVEAGYWRHRMVSGLTILNTEDTFEARGDWSYLVLADELRRRSSKSTADLVELYRRMVFNALISNTDDHPRNHALIAPGRDFELSPAYDLTPNPVMSLEKRDLAMTAGDFNRYANRINLLSGHARFKLSREDASAIIDRMQRIVRHRWHALLREHGTSEADCESVAGAFNYPGFEFEPSQVLESL
jgi:serine/threonine-protein kinase HipA